MDHGPWNKFQGPLTEGLDYSVIVISRTEIEITLVEEDVSVGRSVDVWRGEPGLEAGHVARASSYFDRMWDLGQKKRRWFLYVRKVEVHVQSLL